MPASALGHAEKKKTLLLNGLNVALPPGFEPGTFRLGSDCSIQLSYGSVGGRSYCSRSGSANLASGAQLARETPVAANLTEPIWCAVGLC